MQPLPVDFFDGEGYLADDKPRTTLIVQRTISRTTDKGTDMEIFGGFMVMLSILGFFLTVLWFILPFVIFAMKGKLDRACELLENIDRRLAVLEGQFNVSDCAGGAGGSGQRA